MANQTNHENLESSIYGLDQPLRYPLAWIADSPLVRAISIIGDCRCL